MPYCLWEIPDNPAFIEIHEGPQDVFFSTLFILITFVTIFDAKKTEC